MKRIINVCTAFAVAIAFAGCSGNTASKSENTAAIEIEDLDLSVEEVVSKGNRQKGKNNHEQKENN